MYSQVLLHPLMRHLIVQLPHHRGIQFRLVLGLVFVQMVFKLRSNLVDFWFAHIFVKLFVLLTFVIGPKVLAQMLVRRWGWITRKLNETAPDFSFVFQKIFQLGAGHWLKVAVLENSLNYMISCLYFCVDRAGQVSWRIQLAIVLIFH